MLIRLKLAFVVVHLIALSSSLAQISISPSGHFIQYAGRTLMLVGESGTQCVTQNANLDYRQWIDDCASRGITVVHVWSFTPPRQKQDGSEIEERWGYVYPGLTPWARMKSGPPAADQLPKWDLKTFDDGADEELTRYWPRMRDLCRYARSKGILVGITLFTGWAKHDKDWLYHPLNRRNGGHLEEVADAVMIESPDTEVLREAWSDSWPSRRQTQWVWERLADETIQQLNPFGNVFFVFLDEHSYSEGNMGGHFARFFRERGAVWADWDQRRRDVDLVYSDTYSHADKNELAVSGFEKAPVRPHFNLEGEPYAGDAVRTSLWSFTMGGGHFIFHADTGQETPRTGIMGYDPHVPGGDKGMNKRDWLGHASRFYNEHVLHLDQMAPHNEVVEPAAFCLAAPGEEYAVYLRQDSPAEFHLDLTATSRVGFVARFYDPKFGTFGEPFSVTGGAKRTFTKPDSSDWVLSVVVETKSGEKKDSQ